MLRQPTEVLTTRVSIEPLTAGDKGMVNCSARKALAIRLPATRSAPQLPATEPRPGPGTPDGGKTALASSHQGDERFAYVTLLTRDSYLMGVQALARSLTAVQARHRLLVMLTPDTLSQQAQAALQAEGCVLLPVQRVQPARHDEVASYKLALYAECWCKLQMWSLEQYKRLVYLDADMVVMRNIDALFTLPEGFYAVADCSHGRQTKAERDACSYLSTSRPQYLNAGFYLMTPSKAERLVFDCLLKDGTVKIGGFAEQDFLNEYYRDRWHPLPLHFNAQKGVASSHPEIWAAAGLQNLAIIHYTDAKPWEPNHPDHQLPAYQPLVKIWWDAYSGWLQPGTLVSAEELQQLQLQQQQLACQQSGVPAQHI